MERDSEGRFFLGKVSRALVREAPCSLLLFANPAREPAPLRKLAVIVDFTPASRHALQAALELAARTGAEEVHVLRVFTVFAQFLAEPHEFIKGQDTDALAAEEARLDAFVEEFDIAAIPIITRCIEGTTGFAAADLCAIHRRGLAGHRRRGGRGPRPFPARMEWLENVIPANLLVIRPPGESAPLAPTPDLHLNLSVTPLRPLYLKRQRLPGTHSCQVLDGPLIEQRIHLPVYLRHENAERAGARVRA